MDFEHLSTLRMIEDALGPGRRVPSLDQTERSLAATRLLFGEPVLGLPMPDAGLEEASP